MILENVKNEIINWNMFNFCGVISECWGLCYYSYELLVYVV